MIKIYENDNSIIYNQDRELPEGLVVVFEGHGNLLVINGNNGYENSQIKFKGNNSIAYISENCNIVYINLTLAHDCTFFLGKNVYINPDNDSALKVDVYEGQTVCIGDDCIISYEVVLMTSDAHLIYDLETNQRNNAAKSIYIGDHVWLGMKSCILGGIIGSGTIVGACSVICSGRYASNNIFAGNPARQIKKGCCFTSGAAAFYDKKRLRQLETLTTHEGIFKIDADMIDVEILDKELKETNNARKKLNILRELIINNTNHNRFFIE